MRKMLTIFLASALLMYGLGYGGSLVHTKPSSTTPSPSPTIPFTKPTLVEPPGTPTPTPTATPTATPTPTPVADIQAPIADFKARITKKMFGTYVTPQNSPVQPERFTGYHTGVDVEYQDTTDDVPVYAIGHGTVVRANYTSGYGGLLVIEHNLDGKHFFSLYGHLRTSSLLKNGTTVNMGDKIGVLGTGYSTETDGERRHLHFAIVTTNTLDVRGYVSSTTELHKIWEDPLSLYQ